MDAELLGQLVDGGSAPVVRHQLRNLGWPETSLNLLLGSNKWPNWARWDNFDQSLKTFSLFREV
jgi:hypothetical protein